VAVADDDPRIVATRPLPSLVTDVERTFPVPPSERTPGSSSIVLNRLGDSLVVGVGGTHVLSAKLVTTARHVRPITSPIAFDPQSRRVLATDEAPATLDGWRVLVLDGSARREPPYSLDGEPLGIVYAHGHGVVLGALAAPDPARSGPATWAIRVLP
jgi:hypothetical protein